MTRMKTLAAAVFLATAASSSTIVALADDEKPDATVSFSGGAVAAGVGVSWGDGTLHYKGKDYPFRLKGLTVVDVGASAVKAAGEVYHLKRLEDFNGNYTAVSAGATVAGGASVTAMENQKGVVMELRSTRQGLQFSTAVEGVAIELRR